MNKKIISILLLVSAVLLSGIIPAYSIIKSITARPNEKMSHEFRVKLEKKIPIVDAKTESIVADDAVYTFEMSGDKLYIQKCNDDFAVTDSNKFNVAESSWNFGVTIKDENKFVVYVRSKFRGRLFKYLVDRETLQLVGKGEIIDDDVRGFSVKDDYLFVHKEDSVKLYKNNDLVFVQNQPRVISSKIVYDKDSVSVVVSQLFDGKGRVGLFTYDIKTGDKDYKRLYTEGPAIHVGSVKDVYKDNGTIYIYNSEVSHKGGLPQTNIIVSKVTDGNFEVIYEDLVRHIQNDGIIYGVENGIPKMIVLVSDRNGVDYYDWKPTGRAVGERLTVTHGAKLGIKRYTRADYTTLFFFGSKALNIVPMFASENPVLVEKSEVIDFSIYVNATVMYLNALMIALMFFGIPILAVVTGVCCILNFLINKFSKLKVNSYKKLTILSLIPFLLGSGWYHNLITDSYTKVCFIDVLQANLYIFMVFVVVIYIISYLFANLRSFEIKDDDCSYRWIFNFVLCFVTLYVANFLLYIFLNSFISNLI